MTLIKTYDVPAAVAERAYIDAAGYEEMYRRSVEDNEAFWAEEAGRIDWIKPFSKVKDVSYARDDLHIRWYYDGTPATTASIVTSTTKETRSPSSGRAMIPTTT